MGEVAIGCWLLGEVAIGCWVWWLLGFVIPVVVASKIVGLRREREREEE